MQLEIPSYLGYDPKWFNVQGYDAQAKNNVFYHDLLNSLFNIGEWVQKTSRKRKKRKEENIEK